MLAWLTLWGCTVPADEPRPDLGEGRGRVGEPLNPFSLPDEAGETLEFADFDDVVLDLAAEGCVPCLQSAETAAEVAAALAEDDVAFVTVLLEAADGGPPSLGDAALWVAYFDLPFPVVVDHLRELQSRWEIRAWPTYVFVRNGTIEDRHDGFLEDEEIVGRSLSGR